MKFLVLALCVCAASAATVYKPFEIVQTPAKEVVTVPVVAAKTVYEPVVQVATKPLYQPFVQATAKAVYQPFPEAAPKAAYQPFAEVAPKATYQPFAEVAPKAVYKVDQAVVLPTVKNAYYSGKEFEAPVVRSDSSVTAEGFDYSYETGNGIAAQANGALKRVGDSEAVVFQGGYRYYAPDGTPVEVTYVADENGFHPQSNLLPVGPPTPDAILRSLAYIAEQTANRKIVQ